VSSASIPAGLWPWLAVAGLGLYHGLNPAMGWLFAVALGLNRNSERVVWLALIPIALGHALGAELLRLAEAHGVGLTGSHVASPGKRR